MLHHNVAFILVFAEPSVCYHRPKKRSEVTEHVERVVDGRRGRVIVE